MIRMSVLFWWSKELQCTMVNNQWGFSLLIFQFLWEDLWMEIKSGRNIFSRLLETSDVWFKKNPGQTTVSDTVLQFVEVFLNQTLALLTHPNIQWQHSDLLHAMESHLHTSIYHFEYIVDVDPLDYQRCSRQFQDLAIRCLLYFRKPIPWFWELFYSR